MDEAMTIVIELANDDHWIEDSHDGPKYCAFCGIPADEVRAGADHLPRCLWERAVQLRDAHEDTSLPLADQPLRAALAFYADHTTWERQLASWTGTDGTTIQTCANPADKDIGDRARVALSMQPAPPPVEDTPAPDPPCDEPERIIQRVEYMEDDDPGHPASIPYRVEKWEIREQRTCWERIALYDTAEEAEANLRR